MGVGGSVWLLLLSKSDNQPFTSTTVEHASAPYNRRCTPCDKSRVEIIGHLSCINSVKIWPYAQLIFVATTRHFASFGQFGLMGYFVANLRTFYRHEQCGSVPKLTNVMSLYVTMQPRDVLSKSLSCKNAFIYCCYKDPCDFKKRS